MPLNIPFDNTYAGLPDGFFVSQNPTPVKAPSLIAFNKDLANLLGFDVGDIDEMAQTFAGNIVPTVWRIVRRREMFGMGRFVEHVVSPQNVDMTEPFRRTGGRQYGFT